MIPTDPPGVSVIIPTYQRRASLERVLDGVQAQVYPRALIEVLVISDGCTDGTVDMVRARRPGLKIRLLEQANQGPAAARNVGLRQARGPYVLFLDDDVVPTPCLIGEHIAAHGQDPNLVVIGPLLPAVGSRAPWILWESETLQRQYTAMETGRWNATWRQLHTGNASVRLEHLQRAGGFDPVFRRAEDIELGWRLRELGLHFRFCRAAAASHIAERTFEAWVRMAYEYGRADIMMGGLPGRRTILDRLTREFNLRHPYTRRLVRWGINHPWTQTLVPRAGRGVARMALAGGHRDLALKIYSGVFNLAYWHGVRDQLGGPPGVIELLSTRLPQQDAESGVRP